MALKPLGNAVFVEVIEHDPNQALIEDFREATGNTEDNLVFSRERRRIEASISQKEKQAQQGQVIATGPDCRELEEGDLIIFPLYSGSMVTIVDEIENSYKRVFVISEVNCLARYREG